MTLASAQLHLQIEVNSDPISGILFEADNEPRRFHGWVELACGIEEARAKRCPGPNSGVGAWGERSQARLS